MSAHHHLDPRRIVRIFIAIWILLLMLLLIPVRTHAQQFDAPPVNSVEMLETSASPSPELINVMAVQIGFLWCVMISYLIAGARRYRAPHPGHPLPRPLP